MVDLSFPAAPTRHPRTGSDYSALSREVKAAGLLERRRTRYAWLITLIVALWCAGAAAFVMLGNSWWQLLLAAYFAVISTQLGFLGHDAGHKQIFTSRAANNVAGLLLANVAVGMSYGWWLDKHVRHHAHPNDEELDPDVSPGALLFTAGQARAARGVSRWFYRYQAYAFFPLLLLEAIHLRVGSIQYLFRAGNPRRGREVALLGLHLVGYLAAVFLVLSPGKAVAFIAIHQGLFGLYLGCSFAPSHKGMPEPDGDESADFLRRQVLTSRNVRGHWLTDAALGGLNYQIEHHLFPSMPRPNLRRAQPIVRRFCATHHVAYLETGLLDSYAQALRHLDNVGRAAVSNRQ